MFGPYEIGQAGRKVFGNVRLREFHIFDCDGHVYLLDVGRPAVHEISSGLAAAIGRLSLDSGCLVPQSVMEELWGLEIIEDVEPGRDATPEAHPGPASEKAEFPVQTVYLFLSQKCNLRCVYCFGNGGEYGARGVMRRDTALRAADWLIENSGSEEQLAINFFGGEPLLNFPLMREVVPYARKQAADKGKQVFFSLVTNGSLFSDKVIAFIRDEGIATAVSFDGPAEYHDRNRPFRNGAGSHDRVRANIRKFLETVPTLKGCATVYGDADPFRIKEAMERAGFTCCSITPASLVLPHGPAGGEAGGATAPWLENMRAFRRQAIRESLAAIRERCVNVNHPPEYIYRLEGIAAEGRRLFNCGIGKRLLAIAANGDVYPCHRFVGVEGMRLGNIAGYSHAGKRNDYHLMTVDNLPACRGCWARYYCGGGCCYLNQAATGDMRRPDASSCQLRKAAIKELLHANLQLDAADKEYLKGILQELKPAQERP